jgi:hypothetical protein
VHARSASLVLGHVLKGCAESTEHPERLRYGFATLSPSGETQVLSATEFAQRHLLEAQAVDVLCEWVYEFTRVCGK